MIKGILEAGDSVSSLDKSMVGQPLFTFFFRRTAINLCRTLYNMGLGVAQPATADALGRTTVGTSRFTEYRSWGIQWRVCTRG
jgi:hypothetical protein